MARPLVHPQRRSAGTSLVIETARRAVSTGGRREHHEGVRYHDIPYSMYQDIPYSGGVFSLGGREICLGERGVLWRSGSSLW